MAFFTRSTFLRTFLPLYLPLVVLLSLVTFLLLRNEIESRDQDYLRTEQANLTIASTTVLGHIQHALLDIRLIQAEPSLQQYLQEPNKEKAWGLTRNLFALSKAKQVYDQIRFLDESGMEISRIDGSGTENTIVPFNKLQHKGHRYYVAEANTLSPNDVYVSPLDLNVENGKVEQPHKPIIRFAMQVQDTKGQRQGIIILNYLARTFLDQLTSIMAEGEGDFLFLNKEGDFFLTPNSADEWGFMFDQPELFIKRHPQAWEYMSRHEGGTFTDDSGFYIFRAIYPRWHLHKLLDGTLTSNGSNTPPGNFDSLRWLLVSHISPEKKSALLYNRIYFPLSIYTILLFMLTAGCVLIVKGRTSTREEEEKIRAITNSAQDAIIMMDDHGIVTFWNPAATKIFGHEASDILGKDIHTLLAPEADRLKFIKAFPAFTKSGTGGIVNKTVEVNCLHKNGTLFPAELSVSAAHINGAWQAVALVHDTSERKEAESQLRKISLAVEESPVGIVITNQDGIIEYVNPKFCQVSQYSAREVIGQNPRILTSGQQSPEFFTQMWASLTAGEEWHGEVCNKKKDGTLFWERLSISPLRNDAGEISHYVAIKEDISKEREVITALQEAKETAEQASKAKGDFVANMSHEIRTPMNAIIGFSELAMEEEMAANLKGYFSKIHQSGQSLLTIINEILDYSKIEAGEFIISPREFHLHTVLDHLASMFSVQVQQKKIELLFHIDDNTPTFLIADDTRLSQILVNLVANAIKFTKEGEIIVRVSVSRQHPLQLTFSVSDTGTGIDPQKIESLFSPFCQEDSSINRQYGGTGLGLTICRQLVELMEGEIKVKSAPGQGSTFSFSLPCEKGTKVTHQQFIAPEELVGLKVLVVDDNKLARQTLHDQLTFLKFQSCLAASGQEALDILADTSPDDPFSLIFMDWQMPELDGLDTSDQIKKNPATAAIPIILVSGNNPQEFASQAQNRVDGLLNKPVTISFLFDSIMNILGQGSHPGQSSHRRDEPPAPTTLAKLQGSRLLLVEDNLINREVATEILTRKGCHVEIAENGQQACEIISSHLQQHEAIPYTAILMDLQMPIMDGISATRKIRHMEAEAKAESTPIIAMTAQAFAEDREQCLAVGMNDFVAKPINRHLLFSTLAKYITSTPDPSPESPTRSVTLRPALPVTLAGFDLQDGLKRLEGNTELFHELLDIFRQEYRNSVDKIEKCLKQGDVSTAIRLAHTVAGASANLGGTLVFQQARELEATLKQGKDHNEPLATFKKTFLQSITELDNMELSPPSSSPAPEQIFRPDIDQRQLTQLYNELEKLLQGSSYQAEEKLQQIKDHGGIPEANSLFYNFESLVSSYQFQAAQELLPALRKQFCDPARWQ
jgi:two-component system, sensor histidine kinase and response regulator